MRLSKLIALDFLCTPAVNFFIAGFSASVGVGELSCPGLSLPPEPLRPASEPGGDKGRDPGITPGDDAIGDDTGEFSARMLSRALGRGIDRVGPVSI